MEEVLKSAFTSFLSDRGLPTECGISEAIGRFVWTCLRQPNSFVNSPLEQITLRGVKKLGIRAPRAEYAEKYQLFKDVKTILSNSWHRPRTYCAEESIRTPEERIWIYSIIKFASLDHQERAYLGRGSELYGGNSLDGGGVLGFLEPFGFLEELDELDDSPVPTPRFDHPSILVILFLYLFGYVERSGTKTSNSGSLDFRDVYISLLLFKGSYVWIKFRDVAIKKIERPRKDGTATVRYEGRFKPRKEKTYFHVGTYENEEDAKAACKIAQFYFGQSPEDTVDLQDGFSFSIPSLTECEWRDLSSELSTVSGEAASKVKRDWIKRKTAEVFKGYKATWTASWINELIDSNAEEQQRGDQQPNLQEGQPGLQEWQLGAGCDNIAEERQQHRAAFQQLEQRNLELQRVIMELRRENWELRQTT